MEAFLKHSDNKLKALVATPSQHQADWLGLVAHYADSLTSLEELTISTLREPNFTDENPVFIDNRPLEENAHQVMPQLDVPTVTEFQCSPNLLRNNQFLKLTPYDQAIDSAAEVHKILSQFKKRFCKLSKLKKLKVLFGHFSLKSAEVFPPV